MYRAGHWRGRGAWLLTFNPPLRSAKVYPYAGILEASRKEQIAARVMVMLRMKAAAGLSHPGTMCGRSSTVGGPHTRIQYVV